MKKINYIIAIATTVSLLLFATSCSNKKECQAAYNIITENQLGMIQAGDDYRADKITLGEFEADVANHNVMIDSYSKQMEVLKCDKMINGGY